MPIIKVHNSTGIHDVRVEDGDIITTSTPVDKLPVIKIFYNGYEISMSTTMTNQQGVNHIDQIMVYRNNRIVHELSNLGESIDTVIEIINRINEK